MQRSFVSIGSGIALAIAAVLVPPTPVSAGTWTKLAHNAPSKANLMLLLSDGTVMCAQNDGSIIGGVVPPGPRQHRELRERHVDLTRTSVAPHPPLLPR
jgi:hypothetical protein